MSDEDVMNEVDEVMSRLDIDGSGMIDYSEWAIGTVNKQDLMSKDKL
jgi:calcium-dependent protein kinase